MASLENKVSLKGVGGKFKNGELKKIVFLKENPMRKVLSKIHIRKLNYFMNK